LYKLIFITHLFLLLSLNIIYLDEQIDIGSALTLTLLSFVESLFLHAILKIVNNPDVADEHHSTSGHEVENRD